MRRLSATAAVAVAALVAPLTASAMADAQAAPESAAAEATTYLHVYWDSEAATMCTGTLIDPQWVLTARHCLQITPWSDGVPQNELVPARIHMMVGREFGTQQADMLGFIYHPDADVALLKLKEPVDAQTVEVSRTPIKAGDSGDIFGWGLDTEKSAGSVVSQASAVVQGVVSDPAVADATAYLTISEGKLRGGDSGGPLFIDGKVAGISSQALRGSNGTEAKSVDVASYADWIDRVLASN